MLDHVERTMMPKGVEHGVGDRGRGGLRRVERTMMPKGVEHPTDTQKLGFSAGVERTMMPKGVEHGGSIRAKRRLGRCGTNNDAERR